MKQKKVRKFNNYIIYSNGRVFSKSSNRFIKPYQLGKKEYSYYYVSLYKNNKSKVFNLARLVLDHFKPEELTIEKNSPLHTDLNMYNNNVNNLSAGTRGDRKRLINTKKNKKRGVYRWLIGKNKFRSAITIQQKCVTIGYYLTYDEAEAAYIKKYKEVYGYDPYVKI